MHIHYQEEKCYDEEIFFYHLGCHQWVSAGERWSTSEFLLTDTSTEFISVCSALTSAFFSFSGGDAVRGRYSHVAAAMEGRVLLVAGGYSGVARGDLVAYKVPLFVSSDQGDRVSTKKTKQEVESFEWLRSVHVRRVTKLSILLAFTRMLFVPRLWMKACV